MKRPWRWPLAGFVVGGLVGATLLTVNVVGAFVGDRGEVRPLSTQSAFGEILHTPPLLVQRGEPVELTYELVCGLREDRPGGTCSPKGSVHVRGVGEHEFAELPLTAGKNGRLSATVPARYTLGSGFAYYAVLDNGRGAAASLPAGGDDAPQHAWTVARQTVVDLGWHVFGRVREPDAITVRAGWGKGDRQVGLNSGREQSRIGPSAFDVAPDASIVMLDQVNQRLVVYPHRAAPRHLPIPFAGGEGDLAVGRNGVIYVLDDGASQSAMPLVRSFGASGSPIAGTPLAEPVADMIHIGPRGPVVHAYPSELWLPTGPGRPPFSPSRQTELASAGRPVAGGLEVIVCASPAQAQLALVRGDRVVRSWLVKGSTNLGEVQLAEPAGGGLVAVVRLWTEKRAEFRVLRLTPTGLADSFAVDPSEWAESASLSRFRLHGKTLYQLRSTPSGVEIATFEIGGPS